MKKNSLLATALVLAFCIAGYIYYVYGVIKQNTYMVLITALIYFLPLFIEFAEDIQTLRFGNQGLFWTMIGCFIVGIVHTTLLITYLVVFDGKFTEDLPTIVKCLIIILPLSCLPIKAYPFGVQISQLAMRNSGTKRK